MKKLLTFLFLIALIGAMSIADALPLTGGVQGIRVSKLYVDGNANVYGTLYSGANVSSGYIGADQTWAANHFLKCAAGTGIFDWSLSSGAFSTSYGVNTLSGNVVIAGQKTFTTGTGAIALNGEMTIAATKGITKTAGIGNFDFSAGSGTFKTSYGVNQLSGDVTIADGKDFSMTGAGTFDTGTGAVSLNGATSITGTNTFATGTGTVSLNGATTISGSNAFTTGTGTTTIKGALSVDATKISTIGPMVKRSTASTTNDTMTTASNDLYFVGAADAGQEITLPTAASMTGRVITFVVTVTPGGGEKFKLLPNGSEKINNAASKTSSTKYDSLTITSDGTEWIETAHEGTWT